MRMVARQQQQLLDLLHNVKVQLSARQDGVLHSTAAHVMLVDSTHYGNDILANLSFVTSTFRARCYMSLCQFIAMLDVLK
jgi:hypothetical protein